jgi:hypothetical protein
MQPLDEDDRGNAFGIVAQSSPRLLLHSLILRCKRLACLPRCHRIMSQLRVHLAHSKQPKPFTL